MEGEEGHDRAGAGRQEHAHAGAGRRHRAELAPEREGRADQTGIGERSALLVLEDRLAGPEAAGGAQQGVEQRGLAVGDLECVGHARRPSLPWILPFGIAVCLACKANVPARACLIPDRRGAI